jgi:predicted double-glycine peptidase
MGPGDFTTTGHYIVLTGYEDGEFTVNDPNSIQRSGERWSYDRISGQIRNLWAMSKAD